MAQMVSPECTGASLGALIGLLINPRANASAAIPSHCRGDQQPAASGAAPPQAIQPDPVKIKLKKTNREIFDEVERIGPYRGTLLQNTY
jgi:hypothetical protein